MSIILILSIILGGQPAADSFEDDIRNEQVWQVAGALLGQDPEKRRAYEWYEHPADAGQWSVYVGMRDKGTECWLGAYWSERTQVWSGLRYECS